MVEKVKILEFKLPIYTKVINLPNVDLQVSMSIAILASVAF